jgi:hypothetical protein
LCRVGVVICSFAGAGPRAVDEQCRAAFQSWLQERLVGTPAQDVEAVVDTLERLFGAWTLMRCRFTSLPNPDASLLRTYGPIHICTHLMRGLSCTMSRGVAATRSGVEHTPPVCVCLCVCVCVCVCVCMCLRAAATRAALGKQARTIGLSRMRDMCAKYDARLRETAEGLGGWVLSVHV